MGVSLVVKQPLLAIPLAFVSHFIADALPHYGTRTFQIKFLTKLWLLDAVLLSVALVLTYVNFGFYSVFIGFIATSPDLQSVYKMTVDEKFEQLPKIPKKGFYSFHANIQKYEKPYNWPFEFLYLTLSLLFIRSVG